MSRRERTKTVDDAATLDAPPEKLVVTHWSTRLLGYRGCDGRAGVAQVPGQPWRRETFKFYTDPKLATKVHDVIGLYLAPPCNAIVLYLDEKSQTEALNRTAPILPRPGLPDRRRRHTTTSATAPRRCSQHLKSPPAR